MKKIWIKTKNRQFGYNRTSKHFVEMMRLIDGVKTFFTSSSLLNERQSFV